MQKRFSYQLIALIILLVFPLGGYSQEILKKEISKTIVVSTKGDSFTSFIFDMYEDTSSKLSLSDIQKIQKFIPKSNRISTGYISSAFWFKFKFHNKTNKDINYYLASSEIIAHEIDCYVVSSNGSVSHSSTGVKYFSKDQGQRPVEQKFIISALAGESKTIYIRMFSHYANMTKWNLFDKEGYISYKHKKSLLFFFIIGAFVALLLYNMMILFFNREESYLYYVLYVSMLILWQISFNGLYPFDTAGSTFAFYSLRGSTVAFLILFLILFTKVILETKKRFAIIDKILIFIAVIMALLGVATLFFFQEAMIVINGSASLIFPFLLYIGIKSYRDGNKTAIFYIIAQIIFLSTSTFFSLMTEGYIEYNMFTRYSFMVHFLR